MKIHVAESQPATHSMKTPRLLVLLLAAIFTMLTPRPAQAQAEVSFDFFYDSLAPYGEWIEIADYGTAWRPLDVDEDWAPYTDGYWAFTDAGWTWVSYEDFGGIVYHYGRWVRVEEEGWCWVPDYEWAPAWVSWRQNDDYVGWAPLPPEARWSPSIGISIWVDRQYDIGPGYYSFCRVRDFGAPVLRPVIVNHRENVTIIRRTVNITNITYNTTYVGGPVIYNGGPTYATINQRSSRRIPALKLVRDADFRFERRGDDNRRERRNDFNARAVGNQLVVSAPTVRPPATRDWMQGKTKKVVAADKVTRGWSGVRSEEVRRELRQEMQKQTKGRTPETAPARPMAQADLQAVPAKADPQAASPVAATPDRRDRSGKNGRTPDSTNPASVVQPMPPTTAEERPAERIPRDRDRGPGSKEPSKPVTVAPGLKPFNPVAETDRKPKQAPAAVIPAPMVVPEAAKPANEAPVAMPEPRQRPGRTAEQPEPTTRGREIAEPKRPQSREADREKMRGNPERPVRDPAAVAAQQAEAQRQAEFMRQQQEQQNAAQKQKAETERVARQQAEAAAGQRKQAEMQQRAAEEAGRAQAVEKARAQEMEVRRRQQSEQQAAEQQQRRQVMEQQRAAQEAARQQVERAAKEQRRERERGDMEQGRKAQEAQREQQRQQGEAQRQQRKMQRPPQPVAPPAAAPSSAPPQPEKERRGRDKDKDR
jgi:hypothetical protein